MQIQNSNLITPEIHVFSRSLSLNRVVSELLEKKECELKSVVFGNSEDIQKILKNNFLENNVDNPKYILVVIGENLRSDYSEEKLLVSYLTNNKNTNVKILLCFPFNQSEKLHKFYEEITTSYVFKYSKISVLFLGDIISIDSPENTPSLLNRILINYNKLKNTEILLGSVYLYPITEYTAGKYLVETLFSIGVSGNSAKAVLGKPLPVNTFLSMIGETSPKKRRFGKIIKVINPKIETVPVFVNTDLRLFFQIKSRTKKSETKHKWLIKLNLPNLNKFNFIKSKIFLIGTIIFASLITPILLLFFTDFSLRISQNKIKQGNILFAEIILNSGSVSHKLSSVFLNQLVKISVAKPIYNKPYERSVIQNKQLSLVGEEIFVLKNTILYLEGLTENPPSSPEYINNIYIGLNSIVTKFKFVVGEGGLNRESGWNVTKLNYIVNLLEHRNKIFGFIKPQKYAIVITDKTKITPSGGKIVSLVTLTLAGDNIEDIKFYSPEDVDNKLQENIKPENVLRKYFNIQNWSFSESNIFSDYKSSALKIEWFLDKGLDIQVDGVVSIEKVNANNLTDLLLRKDSKNKLEAIYEINNLLNSKSILVYLNDDASNKSLIDLNWAGEIDNGYCGIHCYSDIMGISELSNTPGGNNIKREVGLSISFQKNIIKRRLTYFLDNPNGFEYNVYLKLLANKDSGVSPVEIINNDSNEIKYADLSSVSGHKEAGVFVKIKPHSATAISFTWESGVSEFNEITNYKYVVRKQPGISPYTLKLKVNSLEKEAKTEDLRFLLTNGGELGYNGELVDDLFSSIFWQK